MHSATGVVALSNATASHTILETGMNGALYLLNALAMAAVVSFHFFAPTSDGQVHVDVQDWVRHPMAQRAGMHEQPQANAVTTTTPALEEMLQTPARRLDRFTF